MGNLIEKEEELIDKILIVDDVSYNIECLRLVL